MEKIKVCFVRFMPTHKKIYMFEMPDDRYLDENDTVIVPDVEGNEQEATVIDTERFQFKYESEKAEFERLLAVAGVELPLKRVIGKVTRTYYDYGEETKNEDED